MAPEVMRDVKYSCYSDVYSLVTVFYEIMTAVQPFEDLEVWKIQYEVIEHGRRPTLPDASEVCPQQCLFMLVFFVFVSVMWR
jgi:serine/threonine protein kinase